MKVCFVAASLDRSAGLGRMVMSITDRLQERDFEIGFVSEQLDSENDQSLTVNFTNPLRSPGRFLGDLWRMRKFFRQYGVVVCFDVKPAGILTHLACIGLRKNILLHVLGTYSLFDPKNQKKNFLINYVLTRSNRLFFVSEFVRKKIEASRPGFTFKDNWSYISVGVDVDLFTTPARGDVLVKKPYVISVGNLKERKGQLLSLQAFHKVQRQYPDLKYVLVGSHSNRPTYVEKLKGYIKDHGLEESVIFFEYVTDDKLINLYSNAEFFVMTPISTEYYIEGFGMVYLESALAGITSVGTLDSGAEAAIVDNKTGLLAEYDVDAVAEKMLMLVTDDELREQLARNAAVHARQFTWTGVVDLYVKELNSLK